MLPPAAELRMGAFENKKLGWGLGRVVPNWTSTLKHLNPTSALDLPDLC